MLVKEYHHLPAIQATRANDEIIKAAQERAALLAVQNGVECYKYNEMLGMCYLTKVRKHRGKVTMTAYSNDAAIIKAANA